MKPKFPKCPIWPRCQCVVQGYVNPREKNDCGRKPKHPPRRRRVVTVEFVWENGR